MEKWVLIDKDAELPENPYVDKLLKHKPTRWERIALSLAHKAYGEAQEDMKAVGWRKVRGIKE